MNDKNLLIRHQFHSETENPKNGTQSTFRDVPRQIIEAIRDGNQAGYREFYLHYYKSIYNFINSLICSPDDAEDLTQDAFIKIWEKREILDPDKGLKAYIFKLARNNAYNFIRKKNTEDSYLACGVATNDEEFASDEEYIAYQTEITHRIAIASMPRLRKEIYLMHHDEDMSYDEIARRMNMDKAAVTNHISRAKKDIEKAVQAMLVFMALLPGNW